MGYPKGVKGYKLWCLEYRFKKCLISRDVIFNEKQLLGLGSIRDLTSTNTERNGNFEFEVDYLI